MNGFCIFCVTFVAALVLVWVTYLLATFERDPPAPRHEVGPGRPLRHEMVPAFVQDEWCGARVDWVEAPVFAPCFAAVLIHDLRRQEGISLFDAASALGVSPSTLGDVERGEQVFLDWPRAIETLGDLAKRRVRDHFRCVTETERKS